MSIIAKVSKEEAYLCLVVMVAAVAIFFWFITLPALGIYLYWRWRKKNPKKIKIKKKDSKALEKLENELQELKSDDKYKFKRCPYCNCFNDWHHKQCIYCSTALE